MYNITFKNSMLNNTEVYFYLCLGVFSSTFPPNSGLVKTTFKNKICFYFFPIIHLQTYKASLYNLSECTNIQYFPIYLHSEILFELSFNAEINSIENQCILRKKNYSSIQGKLSVHMRKTFGWYKEKWRKLTRHTWAWRWSSGGWGSRSDPGWASACSPWYLHRIKYLQFTGTVSKDHRIWSAKNLPRTLYKLSQ